jgi:hypothetical protein
MLSVAYAMNLSLAYFDKPRANVENAMKVEPVGEFELKGIRRPLAAYNVLTAS